MATRFKLFILVLAGVLPVSPGFSMDILETFSGNGEFSDADDNVDGFDVPKWEFKSSNWDRSTEKSLETGAFSFAVRGNGSPPDAHSEQLMLEGFKWNGSFVQRVELRNVELMTNGVGDGTSNLIMQHAFDEDDPGRDAFRMTVSQAEDNTGARIRTQVQFDNVLHDVEVGENIAMELVFHEDLSLVEFRFDGNIDDSIPGIEVRREQLSPQLSARTATIFSGAYNRSSARTDVDSFSVRQLRDGDFNYNFIIDSQDVDLLAVAIRDGNGDLRRDITNDGLVDSLDRDAWVHEIAKTYYGDANLDGEFNSADLVSIFNFAQYEDSIAGSSTWESGDWNLDGDFTTTDLILAFQDGGYENGPLAIVPEPAFSLLPLLLLLFRRRSQHMNYAGNLKGTDNDQ